MEENNSSFFPILKAVLVVVLIVSAVVLISLFGAYMSEKSAYIEANTSSTGIVADKTYRTRYDDQLATRYSITIDRYTINAAGEVQTRTETYTISYEDWAQIEVGHIATYNPDGSIDIDPPAEGEGLPEYQPPEPFDLTFAQYLQRETSKIAEEAKSFFEVTIPEFFSSETNIVLVAVAIAVLAVTASIIYQHREEINARMDAFIVRFMENNTDILDEEADEEEYTDEEDDELWPTMQTTRSESRLSTFLNPYADDAEDIDCYEDESDELSSGANIVRKGCAGASQEYLEQRAQPAAQQPSEPAQASSPTGQPSNIHQTEIKNNQPPVLTVRQIRDLFDGLTQFEITENYTSRASGYNSVLTAEYDDRPVTKKLAVSSGFSPKLILDITPQTF